MLESKLLFRQQLAARPLAEELRLLDELRERALVLRRTSPSAASRVGEAPGPYGTDKSE